MKNVKNIYLIDPTGKEVIMVIKLELVEIKSDKLYVSPPVNLEAGVYFLRIEERGYKSPCVKKVIVKK